MTKKKLLIGTISAVALISALYIGCNNESVPVDRTPAITAEYLSGEFTVVSDPGAGVAGETNIYFNPGTGIFYVDSQPGYFLTGPVVTQLITIFGSNGVTAPDRITFSSGSVTGITIMQIPTVAKVNNLLRAVDAVTLGSTVITVVDAGQTLTIPAGKRLNLGNSGARILLIHATASGASSGKLEIGATAPTLSTTGDIIYTGDKPLIISSGFVGVRGVTGLQGSNLQAYGFDNISPTEGKTLKSLTTSTGYNAADITITGGSLSASALFQSSNYTQTSGLSGEFTVTTPPAAPLTANANPGDIAYVREDLTAATPIRAKLYLGINEVYELDPFDDADLIRHLNEIWADPAIPLVGVDPGDKITFSNGVATLFTISKDTTVNPAIQPSADKVTTLLGFANVVLDPTVVLEVATGEELSIPAGRTLGLTNAVGGGTTITLKAGSPGGILKTGAPTGTLGTNGVITSTAPNSMTLGFINGELIVPGKQSELDVNLGGTWGFDNITTKGQTFVSLEASGGDITITGVPLLSASSKLRALTDD